MKITKIGINGLKLIKKFEGCKLNAYKCPAGFWTIGWGSTYYRDGSKVKDGDVITQGEADALLLTTLEKYEKAVDSFTRDDINQNQFDALVSFAYNCGDYALKNSTLLKKVNANPNDPTIVNEYHKWTRGGGKVLPGLVRRRKEEAELYFTK
jgi:lysozyme